MVNGFLMLFQIIGSDPVVRPVQFLLQLSWWFIRLQFKKGKEHTFMYVIGVLHGTVLGLRLFLIRASTLSFESLGSFLRIALYVLWQAKLHFRYPLNH